MSTTATTATITASVVWMVVRENDLVTVHRTEEGARKEADRWADEIHQFTGWRPSPWVCKTEVQD